MLISKWFWSSWICGGSFFLFFILTPCRRYEICRNYWKSMWWREKKTNKPTYGYSYSSNAFMEINSEMILYLTNWFQSILFLRSSSNNCVIPNNSVNIAICYFHYSHYSFEPQISPPYKHTHINSNNHNNTFHSLQCFFVVVMWSRALPFLPAFRFDQWKSDFEHVKLTESHSKEFIDINITARQHRRYNARQTINERLR